MGLRMKVVIWMLRSGKCGKGGDDAVVDVW